MEEKSPSSIHSTSLNLSNMSTCVRACSDCLALQTSDASSEAASGGESLSMKGWKLSGRDRTPVTWEVL